MSRTKERFWCAWMSFASDLHAIRQQQHWQRLQQLWRVAIMPKPIPLRAITTASPNPVSLHWSAATSAINSYVVSSIKDSSVTVIGQLLSPSSLSSSPSHQSSFSSVLLILAVLSSSVSSFISYGLQPHLDHISAYIPAFSTPYNIQPVFDVTSS